MTSEAGHVALVSTDASSQAWLERWGSHTRVIQALLSVLLDRAGTLRPYSADTADNICKHAFVSLNYDFIPPATAQAAITSVCVLSLCIDHLMNTAEFNYLHVQAPLHTVNTSMLQTPHVCEHLGLFTQRSPVWLSKFTIVYST